MSARLPLPILMLTLAGCIAFVGAFAVLMEAHRYQEGEYLDSPTHPQALCQHLNNEIPLGAKRFDPALNAEYRSCVNNEYLKDYLRLAAPFLIGAALCIIIAGREWLKARRRRIPVVVTTGS